MTPSFTQRLLASVGAWPASPHRAARRSALCATQRGNRRERVFFEDGDYALYLDLLAEAAEKVGVAIWGYCLMSNHVHIIATPSDEDGLRRTFGNTSIAAIPATSMRGCG